MNTNGNATALVAAVFESLGRCLTTASAREILALRADDFSRRRVEELADKCNAGTLSPEERVEYQLCVEVGDFAALLQAKARRYLSSAHAGS